MFSPFLCEVVAVVAIDLAMDGMLIEMLYVELFSLDQ